MGTLFNLGSITVKNNLRFSHLFYFCLYFSRNALHFTRIGFFETKPSSLRKKTFYKKLQWFAWKLYVERLIFATLFIAKIFAAQVKIQQDPNLKMSNSFLNPGDLLIKFSSFLLFLYLHEKINDRPSLYLWHLKI